MATVKFLTDLLCAGGTPIAVVPSLSAGTYPRNLDHSGKLQLRVPHESEYLADISLNTVAHVTDDCGRVYEFLVSDIDDGIEAGGGDLVTISAEPAIMRLGDIGLIYQATATTAERVYNGGLENATCYQYLSTYVMPWLTAESISWISIGTVDSTKRLSYAWDGATPLAVLQSITSQLGFELDFRRNGDVGYYIDIVAARGSSLSTVLARTDRNVIYLRRQRRKDPLKTVVVPYGIVPNGAIERATIGYNAFKVTAKAADVLTIADPNDLGNAIIFDDQLNGLYALAPDATLKQITDSDAAAQTITLATGGGSAFAVDDHVEIRRNSSGGLLTELTSPTAIADFGRIVGTTELSTARGERNHLPNPMFNSWTSALPIDVLTGNADGAHSSATTVNLKNMTVGAVINVGDVLDLGTGGVFAITTGGTVNASGLVSLGITSPPSVTVSDNATALVWRVGSLPAGYARSSTQQAYARVQAAGGTLAGLVNGALTGTRHVVLDGLTAGATIHAGALLDFGTASNRFAAGTVTVDGAGNATVPLMGLGQGYVDNESVSITNPVLDGDHGTYALMLPSTISGTPYIQTPSYTIKHTTDMPLLWCSVGVTLAFGAMSQASPYTLASASGVKLDVRNVDAGTSLGTVQDGEQVLVTGDFVDITLRRSVELSADTRVALRVNGPDVAINSVAVDPFIFVRWFMVSIGADPDVAPIDGSHGNVLWHHGNSKLDASATEPRSYQLRLAELCRLNPDLASETLDVGQTLRLMTVDGLAGNAGLDVTTRITSVVFDLVDPLNTMITAETIDPRLTTSIAKARAQKVYVDVSVTVNASTGAVVDPTEVAAGTNTQTISSTKTGSTGTTVGQHNSNRGVITGGQLATDDGTSAIPITKYKRAGGV